MLQASFQKIDLQGLAADLLLQFGNATLISAAIAVTLEGFHAVVTEFALPTVEHVGADLTGSGDFANRGAQFQTPNGSFFEFLRERPS